MRVEPGWNDIDKGKLLIRPPELLQFFHLEAKQKELAK
jgi:hypothetical protein